MSLPSGYTRLEYIESHGTEYFDTGFVPNSNTRVVMDIKNLATDTAYIFGACTTLNTYSYSLPITSATTLRSDFCSAFESRLTITLTSVLGRYTIDKNKNVCTANGVSVTNTSQTFNCAYNLYLLSQNRAGEAATYAVVKLYSCQIYDNGTLIRDYIPAMNASDTVGLWDNVNSTFYTNAGTGTFGYHISKKHKTLIGGTGYEIKSGRVLIGGTGYDIKKGRTRIGGTGYDIAFTTPLGELDEGTLVKLNEEGSPVEFYVAKHDYESDLNGTGRTLLVRKNCYTIAYYFIQGIYPSGPAFVYSSIYKWFNNDYYNLLDANVQSIIGTTKYKYRTTINNNSTTNIISTAESAIFTMSISEVFDNTTYEDGALLPISEDLKIAYLNGSAVDQWTRTRSVDSNYSEYLSYITSSGDWRRMEGTAMVSKGVRPIFTLPSDVEFDSELMLAI